MYGFQRYRLAHKLVYVLLYSPESVFKQYASIDQMGRITLNNRAICERCNMTNHRLHEQIDHLKECGIISDVVQTKKGYVRFILRPPPLFRLIDSELVKGAEKLTKIREILDND